MIVDVSRGEVRVVGPEDLQRFHVAVAPDVADLDATLRSSGFGRLDRETGDALIAVAAVRRAVQGRVGAGWEEGFEGMLSYAASKGWLDQGRSLIRAHVEPAG